LQAHFSREEGVGEFVLGVRVVLVRGFEYGVATHVLDGVHGEDKVPQIAQVLQERQFGQIRRHALHADKTVPGEEPVHLGQSFPVLVCRECPRRLTFRAVCVILR